MRRECNKLSQIGVPASHTPCCNLIKNMATDKRDRSAERQEDPSCPVSWPYTGSPATHLFFRGRPVTSSVLRKKGRRSKYIYSQCTIQREELRHGPGTAFYGYSTTGDVPILTILKEYSVSAWYRLMVFISTSKSGIIVMTASGSLFANLWKDGARRTFKDLRSTGAFEIP